MFRLAKEDLKVPTRLLGINYITDRYTMYWEMEKIVVSEKPTYREMASSAASVFDPLGCLQPMVAWFAMLDNETQKERIKYEPVGKNKNLLKCKRNYDEHASEEIVRKWRRGMRMLKSQYEAQRYVKIIKYYVMYSNASDKS